MYLWSCGSAPQSRSTSSTAGTIRGKSLPVTTASTNALSSRLALSLDERLGRARVQAHFLKEKQIHLHNHYDAANHNIKTEVEEVWYAKSYLSLSKVSVFVSFFFNN